MAQVYVIGRITNELELKHGQNENSYVRFSFAENIGSKDRARTQYYQVWAWGEDAERLIKAGVKKGSLIFIAGAIELETYTKQDGFTVDKRLKVSLNDWGFVPFGNGRANNSLHNKRSSADAPLRTATINGDKDTLPE
ncbi:MAG: single-stranded DNA-binding protein [Bacteroidaceae bacterium]|nr:single-stranded DNA-binding protein [Bacteroidaceae bacterium]